jgi:hypothetical protein
MNTVPRNDHVIEFSFNTLSTVRILLRAIRGIWVHVPTLFMLWFGTKINSPNTEGPVLA